MNTTHPTPASITDSAIISSYKSYNYGMGDGRFVSNFETPPTSATTTNVKRYSRTELYDFRNSTISRTPPEPSLRTDLYSLGVWKFKSPNPHQNGNNNSSGDGITHVTGHCLSSSMPLSTNHLSGRSQRSPSTRDHTTTIAASSANHNVVHHSIQKNYIDQRSMSSSHLMPAFAKRRIAATNSTASGTSQNITCDSSNYGSNSPVDTRSQSPIEKQSYNSLHSSSHIKQRSKEHLHEYPRGLNDSGEDHGIFMSPKKKISVDHDRERDRDRDNELSSGRLSSPVTLGNSRHSHSGSAHERRIGSGRLLPRDVNWDYRAGHDKEKNQSISIPEKESPSGHILQSRNSGRFAERLHDRNGSNTGFIERRSFDRRTGGSSEDKYDTINNSPSRNSHITRREMYADSSSNQQTATHSKNRRNHQYNDRSEEPEWFSGGPTSQHDTIELRGFEEIDENYGSNTNVTTSRSIVPGSGRKLSESSSSRGSSTLNLSNSKSKEQLLGLKERDIDSNINVPPDSINTGNDLVSDQELSSGESCKLPLFKNVNGDSNNNKNNNSPEVLHYEKDKNANDSMLQTFLQEKCETNSTRIDSKTPSKEAEFNFDAFLNPNLDLLKHTLMRGDSFIGNDNENIGSSRFSRWFGNKTTNDMKSEFTGISESSSSGTAKEPPSNKEISDPQNKTITLTEFLQLSKLPPMCDTSISQKAPIPSVEELEARMRVIDVGSETVSDTSMLNSTASKAKEPDHSREPDSQADHQLTLAQSQAREIEAFKKLLEQLGSGNKQQQHQQYHNSQSQQPHIPQPNMPMNILLQQQQQNHAGSIPPMNVVIAQHHSQSLQPQLLLKNDELKKIMQQQMLNQQPHHPKQLQTVLPQSHGIHQHMPQISPQGISQHTADLTGISAAQSQGISLSAFFASHPQKRLEAQHLFQSVTRGEVSRNFLEQELNNPATSPHTREVIVAVLRESARSVTPSTNINVNMPPSQSLGNASAIALQHQQLASPIPVASGIPNGPPQTQGPLNGSGAVSQQQLLQQMPNPNVILSGQPDQRIPLPHGLPNHHPGLPSPRELQFHTQNIMQNAMLKKKLEEQENLRRRQEMQKQLQSNIMMPGLNEIDLQQKNLQQHMQQPQIVSQQQTHISHNIQQQPTQHISSPTPLAFTPTSVLRKMTAEKESSNLNTNHQQPNTSMQQQQKQPGPSAYINTQCSQQMLQQPAISTQPRMILGGNHAQQQHQQQQINNGPQITGISQQQQTVQQMRNTMPQIKWPVHFMNQNINVNKPMGRPILKGPLPTVQSPNPQQQPPQQSIPSMQQQLPQMTFASKFDFQQIQQQKLKSNQTPQHMMNQSAQPFPQHTSPQQQPTQQSPQNQAHNNLIAQQQQQLFQQHQQRSLALQRQHQQMQLHHQIHQQQSLDAANRNIGIPPPVSVSDSNVVSNNNSAAVATAAAVGIINYQRDGGLSPTSNQLAQWFSPELLAQASAGKLPLLNMNQALSLEEFERSMQHSSAAVHN